MFKWRSIIVEKNVHSLELAKRNLAQNSLAGISEVFTQPRLPVKFSIILKILKGVFYKILILAKFIYLPIYISPIYLLQRPRRTHFFATILFYDAPKWSQSLLKVLNYSPNISLTKYDDKNLAYDWRNWTCWISVYFTIVWHRSFYA